MSNSWPMVPLGELLTKSEEWVNINPEETYKEVTVRLWGKGVALRRDVSGTEIAASRRLRVKAEQFILSRIDARNGAFGLVPDSLDSAVVSNDFPVFGPNPSRILPSFLNWMSKTRDFVNICKAASEGTTNRVRLQEDRFLAMNIPLPPLSEQRRIVARIDELAAKIEEARRLRQLSAEEVDAFVVSVHIHLAGKRRKRLGEIVKLDEKQVPVALDGAYPQSGVKSFGGGLFPKPAISASETTYKAFNRLYEGALVLSQVKGWEGAVAVCPANLAGWFVSPEYRTFRCVEGEARPRYLAALVRTEWFWGRLVHATRGVGARRERTRPEQFLNIEIPMPEFDQQRQGEKLFGQVDILKHLQAETVPELDAMLPSMLDRAFKGDLL